MQSAFLTIVIWTVSIAVLLACSPEGEEGNPTDIVGKVYFSHAVVIGRVVMRYPTPNLSPNAYTVTMQVECIVKDNLGTVTMPNFNITEAGKLRAVQREFDVVGCFFLCV